MNWLLLYAFMTFSPVHPTRLSLPEPQQPYYNFQLGYQSFEGNKKQAPLSWNTISLKDISCTVVDAVVIINEQNNFVASLKILYLKIGCL